MGTTYIDYHNSLERINEIRGRLLDPDIAIWRQAGNQEWCKLLHVTNVHRNSSFGTAFEARREPPWGERKAMSSPMCVRNPLVDSREDEALPITLWGAKGDYSFNKISLIRRPPPLTDPRLPW